MTTMLTRFVLYTPDFVSVEDFFAFFAWILASPRTTFWGWPFREMSAKTFSSRSSCFRGVTVASYGVSLRIVLERYVVERCLCFPTYQAVIEL